MRYLIIEDSRLARQELRALLDNFPDLEAVGEAADGPTAIAKIQEQQPDLLFLDIQLPGKNGFEVLDALETVPKVIFTTAFDEYAIRSFEYNTIDYLVKPIQLAHLERALKKVQQTEPREDPQVLKPDQRIFIKDGGKGWLVQVNDIRLLESYGNYTRVFFRDQGPLILKTLNHLETVLDPQQFIRINRSQIVNLKRIQAIQVRPNGALELSLDAGTPVVVSRRQSKRFRELFGI